MCVALLLLLQKALFWQHEKLLLLTSIINLPPRLVPHSPLLMKRSKVLKLFTVWAEFYFMLWLRRERTEKVFFTIFKWKLLLGKSMITLIFLKKHCLILWFKYDYLKKKIDTNFWNIKTEQKAPSKMRLHWGRIKLIWILVATFNLFIPIGINVYYLSISAACWLQFLFQSKPFSSLALQVIWEYIYLCIYITADSLLSWQYLFKSYFSCTVLGGWREFVYDFRRKLFWLILSFLPEKIYICMCVYMYIKEKKMK